MIPDLFPKNKSFALAVYNCAIYVGRGLMFVLITGARSVGFAGIVTLVGHVCGTCRMRGSNKAKSMRVLGGCRWGACGAGWKPLRLLLHKA